jgi:hypothetical protein
MNRRSLLSALFAPLLAGCAGSYGAQDDLQELCPLKHQQTPVVLGEMDNEELVRCAECRVVYTRARMEVESQ